MKKHKINFCKYHGTGNDFVIIDNRQTQLTDKTFNKDTVSFLCHRRFGIGADGLMLLEKHNDLDFKMRYFNSDGSEASLCGNGSRCIIAFAKRLNIFESTVNFEAADGAHQGEFIDSDEPIVRFKLNDVKNIDVHSDYYFTDTGSPHHIIFVDDVENYDIVTQGAKIRYSEQYPKGTNVNFVQIVAGGLIVRTYERGVEDETYSCGTGVTASALAAYIHTAKKQTSFDIKTKGGRLRVCFDAKTDGTFENIWLEGPAQFVFEGSIEFALI